MISHLSFLFVCPYKCLKLLLSQKFCGKKNSGDYNVLLCSFCLFWFLQETAIHRQC